MAENSKSFTGRKRKRVTSQSVHVANAAAKHIITLGGILTIVSVLLVCFFLVYVVIPLFAPQSIENKKAITAGNTAINANIVKLGTDEYLTLGFALYSNGVLQVINLNDGVVISSSSLFEQRIPTAWSVANDNSTLAVGFEDGSVSLGEIEFNVEFLEKEDVPEDLHTMEVDHSAQYKDGMLQLTPEHQFRYMSLTINFADPVTLSPESPIVALDQTVSTIGTVLAALSTDGKLRLSKIRTKTNMLTGKETITATTGEIVVEDLDSSNWPTALKLAGLGETVYLIWKDGSLRRYDTRDIDDMHLMERVMLLDDNEREVTAIEFVLGKQSIIIGDSKGGLNVWFPIRSELAGTDDGMMLTQVHELKNQQKKVTAIGISQRTRQIVAGYEDGSVSLFHVTSEKLIASGTFAESTMPIQAVTMTPKDDFIIASTEQQRFLWKINAPHPETTLASLFAPVWYEGYPKPENVWQTSSATDDFEPKFGMLPLIFGTVKATFYSMLFGLPIAILAAIYTSEFLHPKRKAVIKPMIEMMASLPSVVLGFLSALVLAPIVEDIVPEVLASIVTVPFVILLGAYIWQMIPPGMAVRFARFRLAAVAIALPIGIFLAGVLGKPLENILFSGDIKSWLDGQIGNGFAGWLILFFPFSVFVVSMLVTQFINPGIRSISTSWGSRKFASIDLVKFLASFALAMLLAILLSWILTATGLDPRGSYLDTYVQRNAMVVGFIMGFAIIPIIYTIAEDALSAVPEHLRAGSLGAGATQWQTAFRIIIPTAMSGLFSATMIGLGRAVGETMIVLMAAGNTPVMDWNIFNGFRTLSANIAVELPEAVQNSTHYRTLFLAALVLFILTFLINTIAEVVRQRFRRRYSQL